MGQHKANTRATLAATLAATQELLRSRTRGAWVTLGRGLGWTWEGLRGCLWGLRAAKGSKAAHDWTRGEGLTSVYICSSYLGTKKVKIRKKDP